MLNHLFTSPITLLYGALAGFVLGFLIQKGRVSQFSTIINQFLLKDFTMIKIMLVAIIVGGIGIYGLHAINFPLQMHIKTNSVIQIVSGGIIMGIGMSYLGYCPGTCVAAAGQGSRDAWWGLLGMLIGAFAYVELHATIQSVIGNTKEITNVTLPAFFGLSPWFFFSTLIIATYILFRKTRITTKEE